MPSKSEVWKAADQLRGRGERVSITTVREELTYGGSNRDVGPLLAAWKVERAYLPVVELANLPEAMQTELTRAASKIWAAALQDASRKFNIDRENGENVIKVERELRDEALSAADVLEQKLKLAHSEIGRLGAELALAKEQVAGFHEKLKKLRSKSRSAEELRREEAEILRNFWDFAMQEIHLAMPPEDAQHAGWTVAEVLENLPESVRIKAKDEAGLIDIPTLSKRMAERALRKRYFERTEDDRYRRLPGWEAKQARKIASRKKLAGDIIAAA